MYTVNPTATLKILKIIVKQLLIKLKCYNRICSLNAEEEEKNMCETYREQKFKWHK